MTPKPSPEKKYKCPDCGKETFEGDRSHYRWWDNKGGYCT